MNTGKGRPAVDRSDPGIDFAMKMAENNPFVEWNRMVVDELDLDHCLMSLELRHEQTNPNGLAHGGLLFTLADASASTLARADGRNYSTLDSNVHFLRNVREGKLYGDSRIIRRGRTSVLVETFVRNEEGKELTRVITTMFCIGTGPKSEKNA